jgi:hypothetical protein
MPDWWQGACLLWWLPVEFLEEAYMKHVINFGPC